MLWQKTRWLDWREFQLLQREHDFFKAVNEETGSKIDCKNSIWS